MAFALQGRWSGKYSKVPAAGVPQVHVAHGDEEPSDIAVEQEFDGGVDVACYFNIQHFFNAKGQVHENGAVQHNPIPILAKKTGWPPSGLIVGEQQKG